MTPSSRPARIAVLFGIAIPLLFAAFTGHAWEDYYITLRASRNLVDGHGLVFNPGERVHTFTSPLGVLGPALCTWIAGADREQVALWLFRLINAVLLGAAVRFAWRRTEELGLGLLGRATFLGLILADAKLIDFATNGMETAILVFFVLQLWSELERTGGPRALPVAIGCAGLMWTRPDAFVLGAALIIPQVLIRQRREAASPVPWRPLLTGILVGGLLYVPWFAFTWWYYGSPIPHTIVAKSQVTAPVQLVDFLTLPWRMLKGDSLLMDLFMPTYWTHGGWPSGLRWLGHFLSVLAAFAWVVPVLSPVARRLSLAVFLGMFYVCMIILFPWYSPPWMVIAALAIGCVADEAAAWATRAGRRWQASLVRVAMLLAVGVQLAVLAATAWEMRTQQRVIENGVRREIGRWLRATAAPGDTVFLEPLGYIGYYSRLKTYDYPGLSSPEVVAVVRGGARRFTEVIAQLRPTWLVLRPFEIADASRLENAAWRDYELVRTWDAHEQLAAVKVLPGRPWLERDAEFRVFRRKPVPAGVAPLPRK